MKIDIDNQNKVTFTLLQTGKSVGLWSFICLAITF